MKPHFSKLRGVWRVNYDRSTAAWGQLPVVVGSTLAAALSKLKSYKPELLDVAKEPE